jgi:hypothetical protein
MEIVKKKHVNDLCKTKSVNTKLRHVSAKYLTVISKIQKAQLSDLHRIYTNVWHLQCHEYKSLPDKFKRGHTVVYIKLYDIFCTGNTQHISNKMQ